MGKNPIADTIQTDVPQTEAVRPMASGKTHDFATYLVLAPLAYVGFRWLALAPAELACLTFGVWFGGIFLSPDLDTRSRPFYRWGFFRFIWWPYQWIAKHRSTLSHGVIFAPFIRLAYLSALGALLYAGIKSGWWIPNTPIDWSFREDIQTFFTEQRSPLLWFAGGVWLGCFVHVVLDAASSWIGEWLGALGLRPR